MSGLSQQRTELMRAIEKQARRPIFDRDPYVKFLPLILDDVEPDWSLAERCDPTSNRRIVIAAFGRDPIAYVGWLRLASIAVHSALHCSGIREWGVDMITGPPPTEFGELSVVELFGQSIENALAIPGTLGVTVTRVDKLASPGDVYRHYDGRTTILLRMDADSALLPQAVEAPFFEFDRAIGYSGLNARHTGRNAIDQLKQPVEGRMAQWPAAMRINEFKWVELVVKAGEKVLGVRTTAAKVLKHMRAVSWPSEGLSYLKGELIEPFVLLREALLVARIVPMWDEESVKLALIGLLGELPECSPIPVLEHWEYGPATSNAAVVNLRNRRSLGSAVREMLDGPSLRPPRLDYLRELVTAVPRRAAAIRGLP